jgi:BCD family chlorophyll transporter-like MFS transporter
MAMPTGTRAGRGLALGAWGAAQATAAGLSIAFGGALRDGISTLASAGHLGAAFDSPTIGYTFVYHTEIGLLFVTLILLGPLVRTRLLTDQTKTTGKLGIADFPT